MVGFDIVDSGSFRTPVSTARWGEGLVTSVGANRHWFHDDVGFWTLLMNMSTWIMGSFSSFSFVCSPFCFFFLCPFPDHFRLPSPILFTFLSPCLSRSSVQYFVFQACVRNKSQEHRAPKPSISSWERRMNRELFFKPWKTVWVCPNVGT